jgi:hypothetical protein
LCVTGWIIDTEQVDSCMKEAGILAGFFLLLAVSVAAAASPLTERLRIDHAALVAAEADFHARRDRGTLQGNELTDYAAYVARLHREVAEDCAALARDGIPVPDGLSCPTSPAAFVAPAAVDQAGEQTSSEKTADLDAELFSGISEFDEMLLREQERIKLATPHAGAGDGTGGGSGGGTGDGTGDGTGGGYGDGDSGEYAGVADEAGEGDSTDYEGSAGSGSTQPAGKSAPPAGTPDGSDDDVVARQLREAAEKETDPVLKKKLWEEYRKYKEGTW